MKIAVLMDDIRTIKTYKDTTFALMLSAQRRGHEVFILQQPDWFVRDGRVSARVQRVELTDRAQDYHRVLEETTLDLSSVAVLLQRKDPPFDLNYIYDSYMLDLLVRAGVRVVNPPAALRNVNEKFAISRVPQATPPTLISRSVADIRAFVREQGTAVLKPLDGMGGMGIFRLSADDNNVSAILETMNPDGRTPLMVQRYLPEVTAGDKRILIINGEPVDHGLARLPKAGEFRANLAAGGTGVVQPLTERDYWLVEQVRPLIAEEGLYLVGLDVIGGHITEINVTSPTCLREIEAATGQDVAGKFWSGLEG